MKKIIFRADAGPLIGYGHFIRSLALAEMLKDDFECHFATVQPSLFQLNEIEKVCDVMALPEGDAHFDVFLSFLKGNEIVILDNYFFTESYQQRIKDIGCKLVCIDDLHDRRFCADIVINHALGVTSQEYVGKPWTSYLLGFDYALLRKPYLEDFPFNPNKTFGCMILIGGSDPNGITRNLVTMLEELHFHQPIAVVVGDGFQDLINLKAKSHVSVFKSISGQEVLDLMNSSTFGIFPASTTSMEACAARLPFVCGHYVKNQINLYNGLKQHGLAVCIDSFEDLTKEKLDLAIQELKKDGTLDAFRAKQASLLDKGSQKRFINAFKQL